MCGCDARRGNLNFAGDTCAMCIEVVLDMWRSRGATPLDEHCPADGTPCPSDEWIFERVARETSQ